MVGIHLDGMPAHCRAPRSFTPKGNLVQPIHLLEYFWEVGGNMRTWKKPMQTQGEHVKLHTWLSICIIFHHITLPAKLGGIL